MGRRYALFWWTASASLLALLSSSKAQYAALSCVAGSDKEDLVQQCTGSGTLALGGQVNPRRAVLRLRIRSIHVDDTLTLA